MTEDRLNEPETAIEAALASLQWRPPSLDRGRVLYLAGQASVRGPKGALHAGRAGWLWPLSAAASLLLAVALGGALLSSARPQVIERVVYVPVERADDSTGALDSVPGAPLESPGSGVRVDYLALRCLVVTRGVDDAMRVGRGTASPEYEALTPGDAYRGPIDWDHNG